MQEGFEAQLAALEAERDGEVWKCGLRGQVSSLGDSGGGQGVSLAGVAVGGGAAGRGFEQQ